MCLGVGPQAPLCYSSLECHSSLGSAASSCSAEHAVSSRHYDEHWGTVERADCWIKCQRDGRTLHVHSQILCLASPVLRDALALLPRQVEGMAGPVYVITLDVDSTGLTAALDMVYPLGHGADPSWVSLASSCITTGVSAAAPCSIVVHATPTRRHTRKQYACMHHPFEHASSMHACSCACKCTRMWHARCMPQRIMHALAALHYTQPRSTAAIAPLLPAASLPRLTLSAGCL